MADNHDIAGTRPARALRLVLRFGATLLVVAGLIAVFDWAQAQLGMLDGDLSAHAMTGLLVLVLVCYALMLAIPFMPGVEIGIALLILQGPAAAPFVYLATVAGLGLAFVAGQYLPLPWLIAALRDLRLQRPADWLARLNAIPRTQRLRLIREHMPRRLGALAIRYRHLSVAVALNTPGNFAVGGGGGIMLVAGLSGIFITPVMLLVVALATAPVPLVVWFAGAGILK